MLSSISVIIPNLNSPIIDQVLTAIETQENVECLKEILVIGKDDYGLVQDRDLVKKINTEVVVPSGTARNIGIDSTDSDLLIFLDSDCLPQSGWLREHIASHEAGYTVVGGGVLPSGTDYWQLSYNLALFHEYLATNKPGNRRFLPTLNLSVERRVINEVAPFDDELLRGQDIEWTARMAQAGFQPYFWPNATVYHNHSRNTMARVWLECARSGYYSRQIRLRHRELSVTQFPLKYRWFLLCAGPAIASVTTLRILSQQLPVFLRNWSTIPALYLTKLAWTWGASRLHEPGRSN